MTTTRLLTVFGIADIAVGIAVWAATGNALVGIAILVVGVALLVAPAVRAQPPDASEIPPSGQSMGRASKTEGALDKARAEEQRLHDETAAEIENVEERPPPTGA